MDAPWGRAQTGSNTEEVQQKPLRGAGWAGAEAFGTSRPGPDVCRGTADFQKQVARVWGSSGPRWHGGRLERVRVFHADPGMWKEGVRVRSFQRTR